VLIPGQALLLEGTSSAIGSITIAVEAKAMTSVASEGVEL
jgi:hypothetical protein